MNRLKDAKEMICTAQQWKQTFTFDRYGNRTFDTTNGNTTTLANGCPVAICNPTANPNDNKLVGTNYDSVGNTSQDANGQTFVYDAENKQVQVNNASGIIGKYWYNGDGQRVKKYVPSTNETTIFVYDAAGKTIAEYSTITANQADAKVSYLTNDHLGSPRITTDANGKVISRRDFMPFGEEIPRANYGSDLVRQKFTGYERDGETGLDYAKARMFGSGVGRFASPDNFLNDTSSSAPQSWNLYAYVQNNPLRYVDPTGEIQKNADGSIKTTERKGLERGDIVIDGKVYQVFGGEIKTKDGKTQLRIGQVEKVFMYADDGTKIEAIKAVGDMQLIDKSSLTQTDNEATFGTASAKTSDIIGSAEPQFTNKSDCHGASFANGEFWVNNNQVKKILKGDGYSITDKPQEGDIGVYGKYKEKKKDGKTEPELKNVDHSVTVKDASEGTVSSVVSKGGIESVTTTTPAKAWTNPKAQVYYWTKRNK